MSFDAPQYLYGLLLSLVPIAACAMAWSHVRRSWRGFDRAALGRVSRLGTGRRWVWMAVLAVLGSNCLVVAAAGPRLATTRLEEVYQTVDVVFLLDTSLSMRARDVAPSRLERARDEVKDFIINRSRGAIGRMGLVTFSGSSIVLSYLTREPSNILFYLDTLQPDGPVVYGTDIGGAVENAVALIERERAADRSLNPSHVVFVLVSDGEDHGDELQRVVAKAGRDGFRIYSIGIGSQAGAAIPVLGADGRWTVVDDERGQPLMATFDEGTLRWAASATGGAYYRSFTGADLRANLDAILASARQLVRVDTVNVERPVEMWFIAAGIVLLGVSLVS